MIKKGRFYKKGVAGPKSNKKTDKNKKRKRNSKARINTREKGSDKKGKQTNEVYSNKTTKTVNGEEKIVRRSKRVAQNMAVPNGGQSKCTKKFCKACGKFGHSRTNHRDCEKNKKRRSANGEFLERFYSLTIFSSFFLCLTYD